MRAIRRFRANARGLAEIVGTLMLVVIVVAAAVAFSIFVAAYQAQLQAEQTAAHNRALEDIRIISVTTSLNMSNHGENYSNLSFVASSLDVNTMTVDEVAINGQVVNFYTVEQLGHSNIQQVCGVCDPSLPKFQGTHEEFNLTSLEQVRIFVNLTVWNSVSEDHGGFFTFYNLTSSGANDFVSISLYTTLGNDFNRVYDAPTAIALTQESQVYSNGNYTLAVEFDGADSIVPANDTIVSWAWSIAGPSSTVVFLQLSGEMALEPQRAFPPGNYNVTLTVTDADDLSGTATIPYVSP